MEKLLEGSKKITIEDIAWELYQGGIKVKWRTVPLKREDFSQYEDYKIWMDTAKDYIKTSSISQLLRDKLGEKDDIKKVMFEITNDDGANDKKKYPVIKVPSSGKPVWYGGARTMMFVYSRDHGNFILEGYSKEVEEYLKKNYTHYFFYHSMWSDGKSRGHWDFWKDNIGFFEPSKARKTWKYEVRPYGGGFFGGPTLSKEELEKKTFRFKRLPKRWIPEFNRL